MWQNANTLVLRGAFWGAYGCFYIICSIFLCSNAFFKKSVHLSSKRMEVMFRFHFMAGHFHTLVDDWLITNGKHSLNWYFLTWADWKLLENSSVNVVSPCHLFMSKSIFTIVDVHSENVNSMLAVFHKV